MSRQSVLFVEHRVLERTIAAGIEYDAGTDEEHEAEALDISELEPYLALIPPREVDLIDMYYRKKKKQKEIANFFSISQGAVSHRLTRAMKRLVFLRDMPKIEDGDLLVLLKEVFTDVDAAVVFFMVRTTCQSKTAQIVNRKLKKGKLTQVKVRHKFLRAEALLVQKAQENLRYKVASELVSYILDGGLYMLHEVKLSHFDRGPRAKMDMAQKV
jgi:hypothetical protein